MGNFLFLFFLTVPFVILIGVIQSVISVKIENRFFKIKHQDVEELDVRVVHYKKEKIISFKEIFYTLFPLKEDIEDFQYYLIISPHIELKVSEKEYIQFSSKRFIKVMKQKIKVEQHSPWYWKPWLFILFNPEIKTFEKELVSYRLL